MAHGVDGSVHHAEVMYHVESMGAIDKQLTSEVEETDEEYLWIFREMKWKDDSETWEPLGVVWKPDPLPLAAYTE
eukprot:5669616-Ditylum_brightwellii.AAC.1